MIARAWQAWAAASVVIVGMLMLLVLGEVDRSPDARGARRTYDYDVGRGALLDRMLGTRASPWGEDRPRTEFEWALPQPSDDDLPPEHLEAAVRVTADAIAIDGGAPTSDEVALARLTIMARVDPALTVQITVDPELPYQRIVGVMDALEAAGVDHVGLTATP